MTVDAERVDEHAEVAEMLSLPVSPWEDSLPHYQRWAVPITDVNAPVLVVDRAGTIIDINDWFCARLGYTRSDLVSSPLWKILPAKFQGGHQAHLDAWFAAGDAQRSRKPGVVSQRVYALGSTGPPIHVRNAAGELVRCEVSLHASPQNRYAAAIVLPLVDVASLRSARNRALGILGVLLFCTAMVASPSYLADAEELRLIGVALLGFIGRDLVPKLLSWATGAPAPEIPKPDATKPTE